MFKILKKNKNYKLIIGLFFGFLFSSSIVVYAWYNDLATDVSYDSSNNWLTATTVQGALDQLAKQRECPLNNICYQNKSTLAPGDYISYTPTKTSYTTDTSKTGYTSTQTINPSELNLWRVLSINVDGTVDIISEYVSSTDVYFQGKEGYKNYVGYLNVLASQYETSGVTVGSRHFGYSNQTEYITSDAYFVNPAPWNCNTGGTCTPDPDDYEAYGGGDTGFRDDYNLVRTVLGTIKANTVGGSASSYWMASRYYSYDSAMYYYWYGRYVDATGVLIYSTMYHYSSAGGGFGTKDSSSYALRPIVRLKSGFSYYGVGNKAYPMEILPPDIGINPGDYVSYTPTKTSYTTDKTKTGYTSTQTINPSELNLWRVLKVNIDGSVEIISDKTSSTTVTFSGKEGYKNLVGYLNVLASQYETTGITSGSRCIGYSNQTEYITDDSKFANPAPWTCMTGNSGCNTVESQGGGDTGYLSDYNLLYNALGTRAATTASNDASVYWMASRVYTYSYDIMYNWYGRDIDTSGNNGYFALYSFLANDFRYDSSAGYIRPIVILKPGLTYSGAGTSASPFIVSN